MAQHISNGIRFVRNLAGGATVLAVVVLTLIYFAPDLLRASSVSVSVPVVFNAAAQELLGEETNAKSVRSASPTGDVVVDMDAWEYTAARLLQPNPTKNGIRHGNNGVGNGVDPPPPGKPPLNDGPGTGPGNPGKKGGKK